MPTNKFSKSILLILFFVLAFTVSGQTKKRKTVKKPDKTAVKTETQITETPKSEAQATQPEETVKTPGKRNARPNSETAPNENSGENAGTSARSAKVIKNKPTYFYQFDQPNFLTSHIYIEHDENGKGKISFRKKDLDEEFTDPVQLSPATLEKLKTHWSALNFLESTEEYQSKERNYVHLGTMKIGMGIDDYERFAEFNWTENADAKALADEYRKIANQYVWIFDVTVARENQPLEAPRVVKSLESYLKRSEISDPAQLIPFLKQLSEDERIPLIARNNAERMIKDIEKKKK